MYPEICRLPGTNFPIFSYGLMMVIGFFAAMQLAKYLARRKGIDPEFFVNVALIALVTGILGARISDILENLPDFTRHDRTAWQNFYNMINIRSGGLTYYGGFLLAAPVLIYYALRKKIALRVGMDILAPCLMVGLAFGRIGCFLNGCCYGAGTQLPWLGVRFPFGSEAYVMQFDHKGGELPKPPPKELLRSDDVSGRSRAELVPRSDVLANQRLRQLASMYRAAPVLPAQLFSSFTAFFLAALLLTYLSVPHFTGRVFALMCVLEGISRFVLELVRVEPARFGPLSLSMVIGLAIAAVGVGLWFSFGNGPKEAGGTPLPTGFWARV